MVTEVPRGRRCGRVAAGGGQVSGAGTACSEAPPAHQRAQRQAQQKGGVWERTEGAALHQQTGAHPL
jgi:hypothetical protein